VSSLVELDVSYNHLEGQVPKLGVFASTAGFKMAGNWALCGGAARQRLPPCRPAKTTTRPGHLLLRIALPIVGLALCCLAVLFVLLRCRRRRSRIADTTARSMINGNNYPRVT